MLARGGLLRVQQQLAARQAAAAATAVAARGQATRRRASSSSSSSSSSTAAAAAAAAGGGGAAVGARGGGGAASSSSSLARRAALTPLLRGAKPVLAAAPGAGAAGAAPFSSQASRLVDEGPRLQASSSSSSPSPQPRPTPTTPRRAPVPAPTAPPAVSTVIPTEAGEEYEGGHGSVAVAAGAPAEVAAQQQPQGEKVSVMAFYVGQKLDLISVVQHHFLSHRGYKISDDILVVPLARGEADPAVIKSALVVFKHGSVVFFNVDDHVQSRYLHALARHCGEVVPQAHRFRETLECRLHPGQDKYHEMGQDVVNLRELNEDAIKVISDVIGHSVALNFYNKKADRMLEDFRVLNNSVEGSGVFTEMDKKDLFKLVALNNKILTDAMSSGLLEQSKPAWNFNRLDLLWNDLRNEFSIGERFSKVEHKINHVQSNTKFFLEILNHQKSNKLEWIIIVLIAAEIVISIVDLSGMVSSVGGGAA